MNTKEPRAPQQIINDAIIAIKEELKKHKGTGLAQIELQFAIVSDEVIIPHIDCKVSASVRV